MANLIVAAGCGIIFGFGLIISDMIQPLKVLNFLDLFGAWDPSLAFVMAAALAVTSLGYALTRSRGRPYLAAQGYWPEASGIDTRLLAGAGLFGVGWGLVGLCPGPALADLATLDPQVIVFVIAMAAGMVAHDAWRSRPRARAAADG